MIRARKAFQRFDFSRYASYIRANPILSPTTVGRFTPTMWCSNLISTWEGEFNVQGTQEGDREKPSKTRYGYSGTITGRFGP